MQTSNRGLRTWLTVTALLAAMMLVIVGCGSSGNAEETALSNVRLSVSASTFTTTARADGVTEVPFYEKLLLEAQFEESIYGLGGQTSVYATVSPASYRIEKSTAPNPNTYRFVLVNPLPGVAEISIFERVDTKPLLFTLSIGVDEDED